DNDDTSDRQLSTALGPAVTKIKKAVREEGVRRSLERGVGHAPSEDDDRCVRVELRGIRYWICSRTSAVPPRRCVRTNASLMVRVRRYSAPVGPMSAIDPKRTLDA